MQNYEDGQRVKIYSVPQQMLIDLLNVREQLPHYVEIPYLDIPEGSKIVAVRHDWESDRLEFKVENEQFPPVPWGCVIERMPSAACRYRIPVKELVLAGERP